VRLVTKELYVPGDTAGTPDPIQTIGRPASYLSLCEQPRLGITTAARGIEGRVGGVAQVLGCFSFGRGEGRFPSAHAPPEPEEERVEHHGQ
jgi:hypothetical protein